MTETPSALKCLLSDLKIRPLCDGVEVEGLTDVQEAALHTFMYKLLAQLSHLQGIVGSDRVDLVLSKRLSAAVEKSKAK